MAVPACVLALCAVALLLWAVRKAVRRARKARRMLRQAIAQRNKRVLQATSGSWTTVFGIAAAVNVACTAIYVSLSRAHIVL